MKKTTIEIPDPLFLKAKIRAARDGLSMRDLFLCAPFFLIFVILITACAAPTAVPPTATLTLMTPTATLGPSPTATPPAPTEGAGTVTATPESFPADVLAVLQDQKYTMTDTNGDGQKDIVAENGETLFRYVLEEDRINGKEWQRMITFTTTEGEKIEMPRFETIDDAMRYISEHAFWRTGADWRSQLDYWTSFDNPKANEFFPIIKKIPGWTSHSAFVSPNLEKFVLLFNSRIGGNSFLLFEPEEDNFAITYVNQPVALLKDDYKVPTPQP